MVDLKANPFNLNDEQIKWVEDTYNSMSLDEKIGQLFVLLKAIPGVNEELIKGTLDQFHQGGLRWQGGDKETVYLQNTTYQKNSKVPLFVAANCDDGGIGAVPEDLLGLRPIVSFPDGENVVLEKAQRMHITWVM